MSTTTIDIGTLIVRSSDIRGGRPRITGWDRSYAPAALFNWRATALPAAVDC